VNGRRFAFAAGVGLPAEVVRRVDTLGRGGDGRRPGDLAFAWAIVRELAERRGRLEPQLEIVGYGRAAAILGPRPVGAAQAATSDGDFRRRLQAALSMPRSRRSLET